MAAIFGAATRLPADNPDSVKLSEARDALALAFQNSDDAAALDAAGHLLTALDAPHPDSVKLDSDDINAVRFARDEWRRRAEQAERSLDEAEARRGTTATCKHCGRSITRENGAWVDPEATGDDVMWRENCDLDDTVAEHEPDDDEPKPDPVLVELFNRPSRLHPDHRDEALRKLLADWFEAEVYRISETGGSADWQAVIDDAKARHETFGIEWSNAFVPDYMREILALSEED
jgi:hypothetical protein